MRKINELAVVTHSYSLNGQDKKHWQNVGSIYQTDDGRVRIRLDAFFNFSALKQDNSDSVWIAVFKPKDKDNNQQQQNQQNNGYGQSYPAQDFDYNASIPAGEPPF